MAVAADEIQVEEGEQTRVLTSYVVIVQVPADPPFDKKDEYYKRVPGMFEAHNKNAAIRQAAKENGSLQDDGELHRYRAVPLSSWKGGLGIKVEMVEQVTVEELD